MHANVAQDSRLLLQSNCSVAKTIVQSNSVAVLAQKMLVVNDYLNLLIFDSYFRALECVITLSLAFLQLVDRRSSWQTQR